MHVYRKIERVRATKKSADDGLGWRPGRRNRRLQGVDQGQRDNTAFTLAPAFKAAGCSSEKTLDETYRLELPEPAGTKVKARGPTVHARLLRGQN